MPLKVSRFGVPIDRGMADSKLNPGAGTAKGRPWLGILFRCCNQYGRIYKNAAGTMYIGRCPRCGCEVSAKVGEGGTNQRFFETR